MSGLFSSLSSAAQSLDAQRYGLDVAGQNIANLNTDGYTRRRLELAELHKLLQERAGVTADHDAFLAGLCAGIRRDEAALAYAVELQARPEIGRAHV